MRMRKHVISLFQGHFAALCVCALLAGIFLTDLVGALSPAIPWLMASLMFCSGLGLRPQDLSSLRRKPWLLPLILFLLHVVIPTLWTGLGALLGFPVEAVMGFAIQSMLPISGSCIVWIGLCRGNITIGMALILADSICTPFIIPYVLSFLFGADVHLDTLRMLRGLFWMLFFPTILALVLNRLSGGGLQRVAGKPLAVFGKLAILTILIINGGVIAPFLHDFDLLLVLVLGMNLVFCLLLLLTSFLLGRLLFTSNEEVLAFTLTAMRSSTTGMVIAMTYFPPLTTLTVAFNMLFQQPVGAWAGKIAMNRLARLEAKKMSGPDDPARPSN